MRIYIFMFLRVYFNLRLVLCLYTHICTYHQKQDIKKTKRLLFKYVSPFLHENPCFRECEGHLFYKPFLPDTVPNVQILPLLGISEMAQKPGFSQHGWLLVKLLGWGLPTWSTSEILDPVLPGGEKKKKSQSAFLEGPCAWLCSQHGAEMTGISETPIYASV